MGTGQLKDHSRLLNDNNRSDILSYFIRVLISYPTLTIDTINVLIRSGASAGLILNIVPTEAIGQDEYPANYKLIAQNPNLINIVYNLLDNRPSKVTANALAFLALLVELSSVDLRIVLPDMFKEALGNGLDLKLILRELDHEL